MQWCHLNILNWPCPEEWRKGYRFVLAFRMMRCPENNPKNINASFLFKR